MPWRESPEELGRARAEHPVVIPTPPGALFGIRTPPAPEAAPAGRCVVLLTRPRSHRNRMWVEAARRLAARGFSAFRFDYHGTGDSEGASEYLNPNQPYREDVVAVLRHLRESFGERRFVLVGSCFDARTALSAFADEAGALDGLVFLAAPVMELDTLVKADADRKGWGHLLRALRNPENWGALTRAERWRYMATVVGRVARRTVAGRPQAELPLARSFVEHFQALVRSRARALFLYGEADAEYGSFRVAERTLFAKLDPAVRSRFEIVVWPGTVHGFLDTPRQRETLEKTLSWIESLAADRPPGAGPERGGAQEVAWTSP